MMGWLFRLWFGVGLYLMMVLYAILQLWFIPIPVTFLGFFCWFGPMLQPAYRGWVGPGILIAEVVVFIIYVQTMISDLH